MSQRREFRDLASLQEARESIDRLDLDPGTETVPIDDADGRILASRVEATIDVPGFDRASKDGYAVRATDTFGADEMDPETLELTGAVHAGETPDLRVEPGQAAEISTGAVLPPGADAVVMVERTAERNRAVEIQTAVAPGDAVMAAGADIAAGERAMGPGTHLTARDIGLLSALGVDKVEVKGRPTVGIISTGDELVRPGGDLDHTRGEIYDVNSYTIATSVREAGGEARIFPHAGDDMDAMEASLVEAAETCDLVLSSGSTSASAVDVIYRVIEERGALLLHGVSVKPGKPMLVGKVAEAAYIGLPGYPVSALTIFRTFVAPAIRKAAGLPDPQTATVDGTMAIEERYSEGRTRFLPVGLNRDGDGRTLVYPVDKGSGATTSLVVADGVVQVDADTEYLSEGEEVTVKLFSPDVRPPRILGAGEDDPLFSGLLDELERPRYLGVGTREGMRRFRDGIPDFALAAGPLRRDPSGAELATWEREWGLVVPAGNPQDIAGLESLVDAEVSFVNRHRDSGLRASLEEAVGRFAEDQGVEMREVTEAISGYDFTVRAHESPARRVKTGDAEAGLGLRTTAESLDLGFVPLGWQPVRVYVAPDRKEKPGVGQLTDVLADLRSTVENRSGYRMTE